ncbi:MAG: hypothetical protein LUB59_04930 [Candidatus Gastranaerophilales bacterium]|nr:hypothetical protein [Candidatus Gastranaerophilales bacterium]
MEIFHSNVEERAFSGLLEDAKGIADKNKESSRRTMAGKLAKLETAAYAAPLPPGRLCL